MLFTTLRVATGGVVLYAQHLRRLAPAGPEACARFAAFARAAAPGVYALEVSAEVFRVTPRSGSRLQEGMPVAWATSPYADWAGPFPKPSSPNLYEPLRRPGVITLLTERAGEEIYESCSAAVLGWDGAALLCVPPDRPRVLSCAEAGLAARLALRPEPLLRSAPLALALVNAVKGCCPLSLPGRPPFPAPLGREIDAALERSAFRPLVAEGAPSD